MRTLGIDCGGSGIKAGVVDRDGALVAERVRIKTPYPLSPQRFVKVLLGLAADMPRFDRVTVGMPGMIRHGVVVVTPHYPNLRGPYSHKDPALDAAWRHWDAGAVLEAEFAVPVRVLNDAEVQGAAVIRGTGLEVVFTLGTGLGCAMYDGGRLAPHLEMSHAPVRKGHTYDTWMGKAQLKRLGAKTWSRRILATVDGLRPVFCWDHLYVGGGNAKHLTTDLGNDVTIVPNLAGILGGVRVWDLDMAR
ncbi:MAG: ROK family protein [Micrococcales bacterium]|nr:ROK family protein [Micrococcales bacterium]